MFCLAMPFAVWLHGFCDGTRHSAVNCASLPHHAGSQQRLWLPKPDWFASCLEANKVNNPADRWQGSEAPSRPVMRALALVRAGQVWESVLTPLNDEELLGFDFYGYPTDFYSLEVQAVMTTDEPFLLSEAQKYKYVRGQDGVARQRGQDFTVTSSVLTVPFYPYTPGMAIGDIKLRHPNGSQVTLTEALSEWHLSMSDSKSSNLWYDVFRVPGAMSRDITIFFNWLASFEPPRTFWRYYACKGQIQQLR